jgi:hypothetical protein
MPDNTRSNFSSKAETQGDLTLTENEFHEVTNTEADQAIEFCKSAIPHNELIGRILRNIYSRIQALEKENACLKEALQLLSQKRRKPDE